MPLGIDVYWHQIIIELLRSHISKVSNLITLQNSEKFKKVTKLSRATKQTNSN